MKIEIPHGRIGALNYFTNRCIIISLFGKKFFSGLKNYFTFIVSRFSGHFLILSFMSSCSPQRIRRGGKGSLQLLADYIRFDTCKDAFGMTIRLIKLDRNLC
jgi:hypothetical protein